MMISPAPAPITPASYRVDFIGDKDPTHPQSWPPGKKFVIALILSYATFVAAFASAVFSTTLASLQDEFHISQEVGTLGITLYVLGFASGPVLWAPLSELYSRRWPIITGMFGYSAFTTATATAKDVQTLLITRFFAGLFSASPVAMVPACLADIFEPYQRGIAVTMFAMAVFAGPFLSPLAGGYIMLRIDLGWRWTMYISAIMGWFSTILLLFWQAETYAPVILVHKARQLRRQTGLWGIHARHEEYEPSLLEMICHNLTRPARMLFTEPIVFLVTLYMSFVYGLMYAMLGAFPIVFQTIHGMNIGDGAVPFLGLVIGEVLGGGYVLVVQRTLRARLAANDGMMVPEWRLPPAAVGGAVFTAGIFWFGWTAFTPSIHWMAPVAAGVLIGFGIISIFLQFINYLVDYYISRAASVLAANTIMRSAVASCFPLFSRQMFDNLGVQWAGTLLGGLALLMVPIPLVFVRYGSHLRGKTGKDTDV